MPLILGGLWQSAWLFVFATAGTAKNPQTDKTVGNRSYTPQKHRFSRLNNIHSDDRFRLHVHLGFRNNLGTVRLLSYCTADLTMFVRRGIWILIGETFPTRTRAKQGALATASNWLWNFLLAFFTPFITGDIHYKYGYIFACAYYPFVGFTTLPLHHTACNLFASVFVFLFLYESSNLSLEAVDQMYNDPNCKPWTSRAWAPPGYTDRRDLVEKTRAAEAAPAVQIEKPTRRWSATGSATYNEPDARPNEKV